MSRQVKFAFFLSIYFYHTDQQSSCISIKTETVAKYQKTSATQPEQKQNATKHVAAIVSPFIWQSVVRRLLCRGCECTNITSARIRVFSVLWQTMEPNGYIIKSLPRCNSNYSKSYQNCAFIVHFGCARYNSCR